MKERVDLYTVAELASILERHARELCPTDCPFCEKEEVIFYDPLEELLDRTEEEHNKTHSKMLGYPFVHICQYCRAESKIAKVKEKRNVKH